MESVKKLFMMYTTFMAKSRHILLFTLGMSVVLNLVLFLRIPTHTKPDIAHIYSEETFAGMFENLDEVPRDRELLAVERHARTNATYEKEPIQYLSKSLEFRWCIF